MPPSAPAPKQPKQRRKVQSPVKRVIPIDTILDAPNTATTTQPEHKLRDKPGAEIKPPPAPDRPFTATEQLATEVALKRLAWEAARQGGVLASTLAKYIAGNNVNTVTARQIVVRLWRRGILVARDSGNPENPFMLLPPHLSNTPDAYSTYEQTVRTQVQQPIQVIGGITGQAR